MRWRGQQQSGNIEDRRGMSAGRIGGIGGIGALIVALISIYFGQDPSAVLSGLNPSEVTEPGAPYQESTREAETRQLVSVVLRDTEQTWQQLFSAAGQNYVEPRLVLFTNAVQSACGSASAAVGPFYCPADSKVYLDLSFFEELKGRFGAPGDFAQAYVVAHEVGHHVQNLLGTSEQVHAARRRQSETEANAMSVRLELQADCYAGIWAHHADASRGLLEAGDVEEGLGAAAAVGDDRLQKRAGGGIAPESFTHGSSEQRARWFRTGLKSGNPTDCDTFAQGARGKL
jgi:uncharacterized protein